MNKTLVVLVCITHLPCISEWCRRDKKGVQTRCCMPSNSTCLSIKPVRSLQTFLCSWPGCSIVRASFKETPSASSGCRESSANLYDDSTVRNRKRLPSGRDAQCFFFRCCALAAVTLTIWHVDIVRHHVHWLNPDINNHGYRSQTPRLCPHSFRTCSLCVQPHEQLLGGKCINGFSRRPRTVSSMDLFWQQA